MLQHIEAHTKAALQQLRMLQDQLSADMAVVHTLEPACAMYRNVARVLLERRESPSPLPPCFFLHPKYLSMMSDLLIVTRHNV
jgi:hypothetical protein